MVDSLFVICVASGIVVDIIILVVAHFLLKRRNKAYNVWDLIRDGDGYPSLARFQFFVWTLVIIACFTTIVTLRIWAGVAAMPGQLPANLLTLMGISTAVVPASQVISKDRYGQEAKSFDKYTPKKLRELKKEKPTGGMLLENGKPSFTRFQMFSWTLLSVLFYILTFAAALNNFYSEYFANLALEEAEQTLEFAKNLVLPEIDQTLVYLMGLSQGGFLGGKMVGPKVPKILNVTPDPLVRDNEGTIRGVNFGDTEDQLWIGSDKITVVEWSDEKIDFKVPKTPAGFVRGVTQIKPTLKIKVGAKEAEEEATIT